MFKKFLTLQLIVILLVVGYLVWQAERSEGMTYEPTTMRTELPPCPNKPNCVSSQATTDEHGAEPIAYTGTMEEAKQKILNVLDDTPRGKRIVNDGNYLHYTFKTWPIPFVDDVEILIDDEAKLIHYRSASRVGHSDLGVNRKRVEKMVRDYKRQ